MVSRSYLARKWLDGLLSRTLPAGWWCSLYTMVTFSNLGYATALRIEAKQRRILRDLLALAVITGGLGTAAVMHRIFRRLARSP